MSCCKRHSFVVRFKSSKTNIVIAENDDVITFNIKSNNIFDGIMDDDTIQNFGLSYDDNHSLHTVGNYHIIIRLGIALFMNCLSNKWFCMNIELFMSSSNVGIKISNYSYLIQVFESNDLLMRYIFSNSCIFKSILRLYIRILSDDNMLDHRYMNMIKTIFATSYYWKFKHIKFMMKENIIVILIEVIQRLICGDSCPCKHDEQLNIIVEILLYMIIIYNKYYDHNDKSIVNAKNKSIRRWNKLIRCRLDILQEYILSQLLKSRDKHMRKWNKRLRKFASAQNNIIKMINTPKMIGHSGALQMCCATNCMNNKWEDELIINRSGALKKCKGCKLVFYCRRKCQKNHWNRIHKYQCKQIRKML